MSTIVSPRRNAEPNEEIEARLQAQIEPFDSFWEAPEDIEKGYSSFHKFYEHNYLQYIPRQKDARILVTSCGPGYFVNLLSKSGYTDVLGIDSDASKVRWAETKGLNCRVARAFTFLASNRQPFDVIFVEQEINHLTKEEVREFLELCRRNLGDSGILIVHSLNGANPITGAEALAQNFDHFYTLTEYSLRQLLESCGFGDVRVVPLNLYVFYSNPLNYVALSIHALTSLICSLYFRLYGKTNRIFSKKIAAICRRKD